MVCDRRPETEMKRLCLAFLMLFLALPAYGQDFDKGFEAYERGFKSASEVDPAPTEGRTPSWVVDTRIVGDN